MSRTIHELDYNGLFKLELSYDSGNLTVRFTDDTVASPRFKHAVLSQLWLDKGKNSRVGITYDAAAGTVTFGRNLQRGGTLHFRDTSDEKNPYDVALCDIAISPNRLQLENQHLLTESDTRRIGSFHHVGPYPRYREGMSIDESDRLRHGFESAVFTDIHTHSSGQISARGLLEVAMQQKPYYYPIHLLRDMGIATDYRAIPAEARSTVKRTPFPPLDKGDEPDMVMAADLHALSPGDLAKLTAALSLSADRQHTFTDLEYSCNRFRYPISKDTTLTRAIRLKEAQEYKDQGVKFALTSYVGIDKPGTLEMLHETIEQLEQDKADDGKPVFTQRYMVGIPRQFSIEKIKEQFELAKTLLDSPYVMGIDMLGAENTKTEGFAQALDAFMAWADKNKPGAFIRVHAGENGKNVNNVKDFLIIAEKYRDLQFLVGHGVYGMDKSTLDLAEELAQRKQITIELNPPSNIALNNIDDVKAIPFEQLRKRHIPFIMGSDCAGTYQTDARQIGRAAFNAGLDEKGLAALIEHQQRVIEHMETYSRHVAESIPFWNEPAGREKHLREIADKIALMTADNRRAALERAQNAPTAKLAEDELKAMLRAQQVELIEPGERAPGLEGKTPVLMIGASGPTWEQMTPGQRKQHAIAIDMLIHSLDPEKSYIVMGRNKDQGVSKIINESVERLKTEGKKAPLRVGLLVNPNFDGKEPYEHLDYLIHHPGNLLDVSKAMVDYVFAHEGAMVAVGGAEFTRNAILEADMRGIRHKTTNPDGTPNRKMMLLLHHENSAGASSEKARLLHPDYRVDGGQQLLKKLFEKRPELADAKASEMSLNDRYKAAEARIKSYGYNRVREGKARSSIGTPTASLGSQQVEALNTDKLYLASLRGTNKTQGK